MHNYELIVDALLADFCNTMNYYKTSLTEPDAGDYDGLSVSGRAGTVISKLSTEELEKIFDFFKLIMANTVSMIPGMPDGSHSPPNIESDEFILII